MPRNIEIKAKIEDLETFMQLAVKCSDGKGKVLIQHDTFFNTPAGRLKLRVQRENSELIYYDRPNQKGPKLSDYIIHPTNNPDSLNEVLAKAYGVRGVVEKKRTLFIAAQTRIHVDEVKNLGNFMELEVVLKDDQSVEEGQAVAADLMQQLQIKETDLLTGAYMDLIEKTLNK